MHHFKTNQNDVDLFFFRPQSTLVQITPTPPIPSPQSTHARLVFIFSPRILMHLGNDKLFLMLASFFNLALIIILVHLEDKIENIGAR